MLYEPAKTFRLECEFIGGVPVTRDQRAHRSWMRIWTFRNDVVTLAEGDRIWEAISLGTFEGSGFVLKPGGFIEREPERAGAAG